MLKERARLIAATALAVDLLALSAAFVLAYWVRDTVLVWGEFAPTRLYPLGSYLPLLPFVLVIWAALLYRGGAYASHRTDSLIDEAWGLVRVNAFGAVLWVLSIYLLRLDERLLGGDKISRLWIVLVASLSALLMLAEKVALRLLSRFVRSRGLNYRNLLIVGTNRTARSCAASIDRHPYWGYRLLGFVGSGAVPAERSIDGHPVLGGAADIQRLLDEDVVDEVLFAIRRPELSRFEELILGLEEEGIIVRLALDLFPHARVRMRIGDLDGIPFLTFSSAPTNLLLLGVKRVLDLAIAAVLLALAFPMMGLIALAIRCTSSGAVLFRQTRCGLNGRPFTLYKFRTMVSDAERRRPAVEHLNEMSGPVFKARSDPRITPLGRLLRRFSLDEMPQLWNVVTGEMSLVGPRPSIPEEVEQYQRWQRRRLSMRPGLTCLWQISGRNEVDFEHWIKMDLEYIDNWTPLLDLKILAKTIPVVLTGRGAS